MKHRIMKIFLMTVISCLLAVCFEPVLPEVFASACAEKDDGPENASTAASHTETPVVRYFTPSSDTSSSSGENGTVDKRRTYEEKVIALVNQEREKAGLSPVTLDETMMTGARVRSQELQSLFSHTRPDGRDCFTVFADLGISSSYRGENVAYANLCKPEDVIAGWMSSEGHKQNILNSRFKRIGVGYYEYGDFCYWAQIFSE